MTTILLGPQRFQTTATTVLRSLGTDGPVATINSGWEEREDVVDELDAALDGRAVHLRLHHRMLDVLAKDHAFASAALAFRDRHDDLLALYRLRPLRPIPHPPPAISGAAVMAGLKPERDPSGSRLVI